MDKFFEQIHFPYSEIRSGQDECMRQIYKTIHDKSQVLISAPTGLGKTISALAPSIFQAKQRGLKVI